MRGRRIPLFVMPGLDPGIHADNTLLRTFRAVFVNASSAWTTGSSPVVTR
jgi:hypothetical protein